MKLIIRTLDLLYIVALGYSILNFNIVSIAMTALAFVIHLGACIIYKRFRHNISTPLFIVTIIFIFMSIYGGTVLHFYIVFEHYDDFLHLWSGAIITLIGYNSLIWFGLDKYSNLSKLFVIVYVFLFNLGFAALWEIYEFSVDTFFGLNAQLGSLTDTMIDIVNAFFASIITISICEFIRIKNRRT